MLMFNTTWVDTGTPVILSRLGPEYYASNLAARTVVNSNAVSLVRGVSLSSRFPVALPAGFVGDFSILPFASFKEGRLVDGGYFDNSGLIAARAVKNEIDRISAEAGLNVEGPPGISRREVRRNYRPARLQRRQVHQEQRNRHADCQRDDEFI